MEGAGVGELVLEEERVGLNVSSVFGILGVRFCNFKFVVDGF